MTPRVAEPGSRYGSGARGRRPPLLPERLLAKLWRAREGRALRTVDGRRVRVLYAGRPAPGHGPDFQDAVVELDGARETGAVELHRTPSDWHAHGHHEDPAYDGVVLHVVSRASPGGPELPVAELRRTRRSVDGEDTEAPLLAALARAGSAQLRQTLVRAGMLRLRERAEAAGRAAGETAVEQAFHKAVFEALGYSENRAPFIELARRAPFAGLRRIGEGLAEEEAAASLTARLLAVAGLGPPGGDAVGPVMERGAWRTAGVRPANHPARRVRAAGALTARVIVAGGWLAACSRAAEAGPAGLERLFTTSGDGAALTGSGRAREIAVNAALPLLAAHGSDGGALAEEAYRRFPALPENAATREARRLAGAEGMRLSACEQQGLIRLYRRGVAGA